jgi:hypothetical protein
MKKLAFALVTIVGLVSLAQAPASACDGDKAEAKHAATQADTGKVQTVSLEGKVVTTGCPIEAARVECTGTSLVVGETKHPIRKAKKGGELAGKAKDTDKVVKVTATQQGEFLTVTDYEIKG